MTKSFPEWKVKAGMKMSPRTPDPGWSGGEMTRHRYLVTATILASPQPAATPRSAGRSGTSRCYDGYTTQASDDITSQKVFHHSDYIASYVSCVTCQVDKYAVSRPQLQDNSCNVLQVTAIYWVLVYGGMERSSGLWLAFWEANAYMSILPLSKTGHNVIVQRIFLEDIPDWPLNSEHCQDQSRHVGKVWQCLEWRVQYLEKHGNTSRFSMRLQPIGKKL